MLSKFKDIHMQLLCTIPAIVCVLLLLHKTDTQGKDYFYEFIPAYQVTGVITGKTSAGDTYWFDTDINGTNHSKYVTAKEYFETKEGSEITYTVSEAERHIHPAPVILVLAIIILASQASVVWTPLASAIIVYGISIKFFGNAVPVESIMLMFVYTTLSDLFNKIQSIRLFHAVNECKSDKFFFWCTKPHETLKTKFCGFVHTRRGMLFNNKEDMVIKELS